MDAPSSGRRREPPAWLWLGLPVVLALLPYAVHAASPRAHDRWIRGELGLVESLTALFLAVAVASGVRAALRSGGPRGLRPWSALLALGCLYFLGEEVSWGQHWFGWRTPEALAAVNEQGETNLHNIGGWTEALLDQGPRNLLTLGAVVGAVAAIVHHRRRRRAHWIWPTLACVPAALLAATVSLPEKLAGDADDAPAWLVEVGGGEAKELFLALFLMLYLLSLAARPPASAGGAAS